MRSPSEEFSMSHEEAHPASPPDGDVVKVIPSHEPSEGFAMHHDDMKALPGRAREEAPVITPVPPPVCIPADAFGILADPFSNPFNLGDFFTLSVDGITGTAPITYAWTINGGAAGTTSTLAYGVSDGDIVGKDAGGLGHISFAVVLKNACNTTGTTLTGIFAAQGTPP